MSTETVTAPNRFTHVIVDSEGRVLAGPGTREWCFSTAESWYAESWSDADEVRIVPATEVAK